jgi:hypothetical protein
MIAINDFLSFRAGCSADPNKESVYTHTVFSVAICYPPRRHYELRVELVNEVVDKPHSKKEAL